jgi:hypothetical protein
MSDLVKDYQVFNTGIAPRASITLTFQSSEEVAWIERAVVEVKRDGRLSPLMAGILRDSISKALGVTAMKDGNPLTPEQLRSIRQGAPVSV